MKEYFRKIFVILFAFFFTFSVYSLTIDNPEYDLYKSLEDKSNVNVVPLEKLLVYENVSRNYFNRNLGIRGFSSSLSSFDLRNDSGKRNVPSMDNQGILSLCWAFSTNNVIESHLLKKGNSEYNLSENQMDYVSRYLGDTGSFGEANTIINALKYWYYGYSPVTESYFGDYFTTYKNRTLREYLYSDNTVADIKEASWIPVFDVRSAFSNYDVNTVVSQLSTYNKTIKNHLVNYGAIATGIYMDFYNKETNLLYNDSSKNYKDYVSSSHAVTIIGWDDNYGTINYNGYSLKGSWLAMNSWGDNTDYFYISYYDPDVYKYLIAVSDAELKKWTNIYSNYIYMYVDNTIDRYTFYKGSNNETVLGVKVFYTGGSTPSITVKMGDGVTTKTSSRTEKLHYGVNYFDVDDFSTSRDIIYVSIDNPDRASYSVSFFTNDSSKEEKYYVKTRDTFENTVGNNMKYHIVSKNIVSGTNYEVKVVDSYNNDITNKFTIVKNKDLINNYSNFNLILKETLSNTNFTVSVYSNGYIDKEEEENTLSGMGTSSNPYLITKAEDLKHLNNSDDYFKLMDDIDLEYSTTNVNGVFYNNTKGFVPLNFSGNFNGNNHTISNLNSFVGGLFGNLKNASVSNLKLDNFNINNMNDELDYSGIFASYIIGSDVNNIEISNSVIKSDKTTGALAGSVQMDANINNVLVNATIDCGDLTGGLVGLLWADDNSEINITNTFLNETTINGKYEFYIGSLIGYVVINVSTSANINISNNKTNTNATQMIGIISNTNNVSYTFSNNEIVTDIFNENVFYLFDKNIWTFSPTNSLYLISFPKAEKVIPELKIEVNKYSLIGDVINIIGDKNKISDIISNVIIDSGISYEFYDKNNKTLKSNDIIGTGGYIKINNNVSTKNYYFVIYGDINGDGRVNIIDTMMCANYILDTKYDSSNLQHRASNVDNNKRIDIVDVIKISNFILNPELGF